jgi:hypothetical protein
MPSPSIVNRQSSIVNRQSLWPYAGALLLILALSAGLLLVVLRNPGPLRLDIGAPGDGYYLRNTFPVERSGSTSLRWTHDQSDFTLHGAPTGPAELELRFYRNASDDPTRPWPVELRVGGRTLATLSARPGWRVYRIVLPPGVLLASGGNAAPLTMHSPTFQPGNGDARALGVALDSLRLAPLAGPASLPLARVAWLTWLLLLFGGIYALASRAFAPSISSQRRAFETLTLIGLVGAGLVWWAWRSPHSLGWFLPTSPTLGLIATLVLIALASMQALASSRALPRPNEPPRNQYDSTSAG